MLKGKKTYIVAGLMLLYQGLRWYFDGTAMDMQPIMEAFGLMTLRAGIAKL